MSKIKHIFICRSAGDNMNAVQKVQIVTGKGIIGDRYYFNEGTFSGLPKGNPKRRDVTFISSEEIDKFNDALNVNIAYDQFRRNIVTVGIDLNKLVGKKFKIGNCCFYGVELCNPCGHLAKSAHQSILYTMRERSGLRAAALSDGILAVDCKFNTR